MGGNIMAFNGAQVVDDDRAEDVRRLLGGLAGSKKIAFGTNNTLNRKPVASNLPVKQTAVPIGAAPFRSAPIESAPPVSQPLQVPVPRVPLQNTSNILPRAPAEKAQQSEMKASELYAPSCQTGTIPTANGGTSVKDAQDLLYQLHQTETQPINGFQSGTATIPDAEPKTTHRRGVPRVGRNGKKKTEVEKENDRLLDELEALGEPALEIPGETPVEENQRLRREVTAAMLKHSFFVRPRQTPPVSRGTSSVASGDSSHQL